MSHQTIPLNCLVASPENVRRTERKAEIDALAASILAHGLLQNLAVKPRDDTHFEVVAGGRRHAALNALAKAGKIARDFPVPCKLIDGESTTESSLAENVHRVAMNAVDEAEAYQALVDQGLATSEIATRFGKPIRHVEQRLALASLSVKVKAAFKRGDIHLDALSAFCIAADHAKQNAVLRALGAPITHGAQVRAMLTQGAMKASDRIALFVGLQAYEEAGGHITHDLFDATCVFIADPDLMSQLAAQKLDAIQGELASIGWGWVEAQLGQGGMSFHSGPRLQPTRRAMTRAERKALTALDAEIAALEEKTNDPENEDENLWSQEEALQEKRRALIAQTEHWDSELIKHAGVVVRINHDGQPHFTYGVIAKADQAKVNRLLAARAPEGQAPAAEVASEDAAPSGPKLPKSIARELTLARTQALRVEVATRPHVGLALAVFALVQSLRQARHEGVNVSVREAAFADHDALETQRAAMLCSLPDDPIVLLDWCFAHDETALLATLSIVIASALDFAHEGASAADRTLHDRADRIAAEVGLDMHRFWTADTSFFARLPKTMLLEIVTSSMANKPAKRRDQQIAVFAKLKREALAKSANRIAKGQWLPGLLITPAMDASVQRSQDGEIDAARIAAE